MPGLRATPSGDGGAGWAGLLQRFYTLAGVPLPPLQRLRDGDVPQPYRALLVHSADMTPTLEAYYGQRLGLTVLSRELESNAYHREVVLRLEQDGRPVEYGVIRIFLDRFPASARDLILRERRPLGAILQSEQIAHFSWPQAFFQMEPDRRVGAFLGLRGSESSSRDDQEVLDVGCARAVCGNGAPGQTPFYLYGRRNVLLDGQRRLLAEVIEIMAPAELQRGLES